MDIIYQRGELRPLKRTAGLTNVFVLGAQLNKFFISYVHLVII